ncbi:CheC, inhibitor of MCP methylation [Methanococcus vannielii SB]|jgi:chemotaxis protein CheC|uniref:CheC, inhibitor of MCP methylation n=1 Tax=Methanococcus vannielii (strain ATCC 35089 / DSM 1224 / JCM 13029 / OCM 148 / SB) TaxID=406327 RepID=A6UNU4_METVS|nr:chemotaxis protein CheC [Methanococcus vannielii]ABR54166.1 CheC, inhibitor of MCP methylation [Methanococcus vannielii SB]
MNLSKEEWDVILKGILEEEFGGEKMLLKTATYSTKNLESIENLGKTAAEKAANFVQEMSGESVDVKVFKVNLTSTPELLDKISDEENKVFTQIDFNGEISGVGVLIFSEESALKMADAMLLGMGMEEESNEKFGEMRVSAINETCNLLISAFVDTIANFMETGLNMTPPNFWIGKMRDLIMNEVKNHKIEAKDSIFTFKSELFSNNIGSGFEVFIVMDPESTNNLFEKI